MGLQFLGEVGLYVPERDAFRINAMDGDRLIECYAQRSALDAIGCPSPADGPTLIEHFEKHRIEIELAAQVKYRRSLTPLTAIEVEAEDLAEIPTDEPA
jgi:hypothetical protein